jgi:hypothetical protein
MCRVTLQKELSADFADLHRFLREENLQNEELENT